MIKAKLAVLLSAAAIALPLSALEVINQTKLANADKAAEILQQELKGIKGSDQVKIILKHDAALDPDKFSIEGNGDAVIITSGKYGFVGASGYFMDNLCNIIRFSHFERGIENANIPLKFAKVDYTPAFKLRDIFFTTQMDGGRFAALRGLNAHGDDTAEFAATNSTINPYGGPKFCHTFWLYISAKEYFAKHPEWFSEINGKRMGKYKGRKTQLCLSNKELRQVFIKKLLDRIASDRKKADAANQPYQYLYDVSQNDVRNHCTCKECDVLVKKYGDTQSGIMLDFVNEVAEAVEKKYPEIRITTFAYQDTEIPPVGIKPHKNIIIVLCDTISNVIKPLSDPENSLMANKIRAWSKLTENLRIWDYDVNFRKPNELPYVNEDVFQKDLQFFRDNNVSQFFVEFEYPAISDVRDYKLFLLTELLRNPDADLAKLKKQFADAYFGKAADLFLSYRELLKNSQQKNNTSIDWMVHPASLTHLDFPIVDAAHKLFDAGEKLLANDPVRLRRWRFARLSLDRATLILTTSLAREYYSGNNTISEYPFAADKIKSRIKAVMETELPDRLPPKAHAAQRNVIRMELAKFHGKINPKAMIVPKEFSHLEKQNVFNTSLENGARNPDAVKYVTDPDSTTGEAIKIEVPSKFATLDHHSLPMPFGIYARQRKKVTASRILRKKDLTPGYNWYRLFSTKLEPGALVFYCFRSWIVQADVSFCFNPSEKDAVYTFYLRAKFTGKLYGGSEKDQDAIYLDRLIVVKEK